MSYSVTRSLSRLCPRLHAIDSSSMLHTRTFSSGAAPKPPGWNPPDPQPPRNPEDEQPPGAFATFGLMGFGALGAVAVAALGVVAVFQIANFVAAGTGRTLQKDLDSPQGVGNIDPAKALAVAKNQSKHQ